MLGDVPEPVVQWSDTSGSRDLRVGELYGLRVWRVLPDGALTGIIHQQEWQPGANRSVCWKRTGWESEGGAFTVRRPVKKTINVYNPPPGKHVLAADAPPAPAAFQSREVWVVTNDGNSGDFHYSFTEPVAVYGGQSEEGHSPHDCQCGFHGYLRGSVDYKTGLTNAGGTSPSVVRVTGIVKAWGKLVLGSRGFRAEQAEVVALARPSATQTVSSGLVVPAATAVGDMRFSQRLGRAASRYGVPLFPGVQEMLSEFPTTPPTVKEKADDRP